MQHRKFLAIAAAPLAAIAVAAPFAVAASHARTLSEGAQEAHILGLPSGYARINTATCKFLVPEVDVKPSASETYARAEDLRHDALDNCLRHRLNTAKTPKPSVDPCWGKQAPPPLVTERADHGAGKPGDEKGAAALQAWVVALYSCELAENGGVQP